METALCLTSLINMQRLRADARICHQTVKVDLRKGKKDINVINLKPLTSHLALYGTKSPKATHTAQQNHKDDHSWKCTLCLCACMRVSVCVSVGPNVIWRWLFDCRVLLTCSFHLNQKLLPVAIEMIIIHKWNIPPSLIFDWATEDCNHLKQQDIH